jgi:hypothetical protein
LAWRKIRCTIFSFASNSFYSAARGIDSPKIPSTADFEFRWNLILARAARIGTEPHGIMKRLTCTVAALEVENFLEEH